jgi:hypothetical protein
MVPTPAAYRDNLLRAYRFQSPQWIPIASGLPWLDWTAHGYDVEELERICLSHAWLFPDFTSGTLRRNHEMVFRDRPDMVAGNAYCDPWGCVWQTKVTGMVGAVTRHPLASWDAQDEFQPPDPDETDGLLPLNWDQLRRDREQARQSGRLFSGWIPHGHTFLRLQDLRGYENLIFDMADGDPRLDRLINLLTDFHCELIRRWLALEPDMITIAEDLGMQSSPMLSPAQFRRYIAPAYERLTQPIKQAGVLVHEHSDGFVLPLIDDIIRTGGDVINLQDLVNGIDHLAAEVKGRIAIDLDIDRQSVTVHGSRQDIDDHIRECVAKLSSPAGGLSLVYQPWPPTPAGNMDAVFTAMEKYAVA